VLGQANTTQYALLKSLAGFDKHSIRAGFSFGTRVPVKLTVAVENLLDDTYFTPYNPAPDPGRSFVFGLTFDWLDVFGS
jgi:outer membrane receptor protein involved in Fe transport